GPRPPLPVRWLLRLRLRSEDRRAVASEMGELFERRRSRDGEREAEAWLRRQWAQYPVRLLLWTRRLPPAPRPARGRRSTGRPRNREGEPMATFWRDLRLSLRSLARRPGLAVTIVLTVGLGLGATTTMWSVVHAVLLEPLPYADPGRLMRIYTDSPPNVFRFSVADWLALDEQQTSFEQVAGYTNVMMTFNRGDVAERVPGKQVTGSYFSLLGIRPLHGRPLGPADDVPGGEPVVVLGHGFAASRLGGAEAALGQVVRLNGVDHTVVGVLPAEVGPFERDQEFFAPARWETPPRKGPFFVSALGRLPEGADRAAADEELRAINRRIFPVWQASYQDQRATWATMDLKEAVIGEVGPRLVLVLGAVGFVLLIASTNAANLLVARAAQRRRELAVRGALGASRARVVQHLLAESTVLATTAAAVGLVLAAAGVRLVSVTGADYIPRAQEVALSGPVLGFLAAATLGSALLFGLVPALAGAWGRFGSGQLSGGSGGRSTTDGAGPRRLRQALVAAQFAIATPLLIASALLLASFAKLQRVDPGFDPENVLTAAVTLPAERYTEPADIAPFWQRAASRIEALPGVVGVAFADGLPPNGVGNINNFDLEDHPTPPGESEPTAPWVSVSPEYFELMGVSLLTGRNFDQRDAAPDAPEVVIVDRAWADRYFPGEEVLGRRLHEGGSPTWTTVVGEVGEVKYLGLDQPDQGTVYWPMVLRSPDQPIEQASSRFAHFVVRTSVDPLTVLAPLRRVVHDLDPALPLESVATLEELVAGSIEVPRLLSRLVAAFAVVALVLSIVGIYGVMSYFVQNHTKEIGIRLALGGRPEAVRRMVVGQGMRVVVLGVALGLAAALALARWLSSLLFEVEAADARIFLAVAAAMLAAALAACLVPARRAAGVDPAISLRVE
ncbi:MAG TPA: ABC transporter permease, partial [Thermoanaerobaculia bacterium]|nr:ABC transporter permease [Thermoanaerobaculia bacterium]